MVSAHEGVAADMEVDDVHVAAFDSAIDLKSTNMEKAVAAFRDLIFQGGLGEEGAVSTRIRESAIYELCDCLVTLNRPKEIKQLISELSAFFESTTKAKTAKIVRRIIDYLGRIDGCTHMQISLCQEVIAWCKQEQRTMLRQRLESRLASYLLQVQNFTDALSIIENLVREVKKLDDKLLLVEIQLVESRIHHALENIPKAKASLTSARASSNAIYCPPLLQAEIDRQAGVLCAVEKDFKTAFSYFYEAYESYNTVNEPSQAISALKYMLLCKIMTNNTSDVYSIINGKAGVKYAGIDIDALRAVAEAHKNRSLHAFQDVLAQYQPQLGGDAIIKAHIDGLYENLLEQNLIRIIDPFSTVQIAHVAKLIDLPLENVEAKLSEMILDKKFNGILDQGAGNLIVYENVESDKTYEAAISTVKELNTVADRLYEKAQRLT